jgi:hypothetical protein
MTTLIPSAQAVEEAIHVLNMAYAAEVELLARQLVSCIKNGECTGIGVFYEALYRTIKTHPRMSDPLAARVVLFTSDKAKHPGVGSDSGTWQIAFAFMYEDVQEAIERILGTSLDRAFEVSK